MKNYDDLMTKRGYIKIAEHRDGKNNLVRTIYTINPNTDKVAHINGTSLSVPMYSVTVWPQDETFQAGYTCSSSVNRLESPQCSSLCNDEHFNRIISKFEKEVAVLDNAFKN